MSLIEWEDKYNVKVTKFNDQHKKLIEIINELHSAMLKGKGKTVLEDLLTKLVEYTKTHFKDEEELFDKYDYSGTAIHKQQHIDFVNKVLDFQQKYLNGDVLITVEIMDFLTKWLTNHIEGSDKKYGDFFNSKSVY